ncbi:MAG: hypothetical protein GXP56_00755 [Deltaproteobacteria bacterium]|nr:hypothetical protein [Deltaproteobacteria bacterium]
MKKNAFILCFLILLFSINSAYAKFPVHLGGFTIGKDIAKYNDKIDLETFRVVAFNKYLGEVEMINLPGFKSGMIAYGLCDKPNKILRIKLKFADSSKNFFDKLLKKYKSQLGPPSEYKGDPFQTMIAWKWSFTNEQKEKISLILQHNNVVEDEKIGTAVKLTLTSQVVKERACYMAKFPGKAKHRSMGKSSQKTLLKLFVPY